MRLLFRLAFTLSTLAVSALHAQTPAPAPAAVPPEGTALWTRYPAISPDGKTIAFAYRGHLFTIPSTGGKATPLTFGPTHDFQPVWSPDGQAIAYASDAYGNFDVFLIPAAGGAPKRLTTHSADELPTGFTPDGKSVLFTAHRMDSYLNAQFPSPRVLPELYQVATEGGKAPAQVLTTPALSARYDHAGKRIVYEDLKGYENLWRKHHVSSVAHDLWLYDPATQTHRKLTTFAGEDRDPVWSADDKTIYYLSEQSGSFNVWKLAVDAEGAKPEQVTHLDKNPVRFLSGAQNGDLCFGYDGGLYVLPAAGGEPRKLPVEFVAGDSGRKVEVLEMSDGATEMALSPDGKEVAFIARGEVFVTSADHGVTKRITYTPTQERNVSFSPDGRKLLFAGETDKSWNLYEAAIVQKKEDEPYFFNATVVDVHLILENGQENFQPRYSPDGKEVAYLENRTTLKVLNLESKQTRLVVPGDQSFSYSDGDQWFDWSPDGKWFLVQFSLPSRWSPEAGLVSADGKSPVFNLTNNGYDDTAPHWSRDGKVMLWASNREGLHGNTPNDFKQGDVFAMFFTQKAFDRFKLSKADYEIAKQAEDDAKKNEGKQKEQEDKNKTPEEKKKEEEAKKEPLEIDLKDIEDRTARLTIGSTDLLDWALTPDDETLVYLMKGDNGFTLWQNKLRDKETKRLAEFPDGPTPNARGEELGSSLTLDKDGGTVFVLAGGRIAKVTLKDGKIEPVKFAAEMTLDHFAERAYLFEHAWRQVKEKLYTADLNGVDWDYYKGVYAKFLASVDNNYDFAELLSEMLGELDVSHTGGGYVPHPAGADDTAAFGVFFDESYRGPGLKVQEIIEKGPLVVAKSRITPGMIVEKIDGTTLTPEMDWCPLLNRKAGRPTLLSVFDPAKNTRFDETVKPIHLRDQEELLYQRWVKSRREEVNKLSNGRLGYVHVRAMNDASYRHTFGEILGRDSGKEGLVVDTRFNGGGYLHDDLATLLSGREYLQWVPRGRVIGEEPNFKWDHKSALLVGESNYSDAHVFPYAYRALGIGKLVGMPVPGTGTFVWWETQQDPSLFFGIPELGLRGRDGNFLENHPIEPDVRVENDYQSVSVGEDKQLEKAVEVLLQP